jgi:hypothetical protein
MEKIEISREDDLLILSVSGKLTATSFIDAVREYYGTGEARNVIWNLSVGALQLLTKSDLREIAETAAASCRGGARSGGKTIFVAHDEDEYRLLCSYLAIAESVGVPIEYHVCRFMNDARDWLKPA